MLATIQAETVDATIDHVVGGIADKSEVTKALPKSEFDDYCDQIIKYAESGFNANLRDRLMAGSVAYNLLMAERARREKFNRDQIVSLIEAEIYKRSHLSRETIKVSTWIKCYKVAEIYFGVSKVKEFDKDKLSRISYGILETVSTLVQRDNDDNYCIKEGCVDIFRSILDEHTTSSPTRLYGSALREKIADHLNDLKNAKKPAPPSDPDKVEEFERKREEAEREEKRARAKRAFKSMSESLAKNGIVKRSEIVEEMVRREFLTPGDIKAAIPNVLNPKDLSSVVPPDAAAFAALCDAKEAVRFVETLVALNKKDVFNAVMSKVLDVSRKLTEKAAIDAKAESEGAALRVSA